MSKRKDSFLEGLAQSCSSPVNAIVQSNSFIKGPISERHNTNPDKDTVLTPGQTIRKYCIHCCGEMVSEVPACDGVDCPYHRYRMGKGKPSVKVIRRFCLECMGGSSRMVAECTTTDCYCHPYRLGKSLASRKGRTAEEMKEMRARKRQFLNEKEVKYERPLQG